MSQLSAAEEALARLGTLGPNRHFRPPNIIIEAEGLSGPADHAIEAGLLGTLEAQGLVYRDPALDAYALTPAGARKAAEVILHKVELAPIDALAVLVQFSGGVSLQKGGNGQVVVQALHGGTMYRATGDTVGQAILDLKAQFDRMVFGG